MQICRGTNFSEEPVANVSFHDEDKCNILPKCLYLSRKLYDVTSERP
jgi:hypothetical protein